MSEYLVTLTMHILADSDEEARVLQEDAAGILAFDSRLAPAVTRVDAPVPREKT